MEVAEAERLTDHRLAATDLEDPLADYSNLSLCPRNFPSLSGAPPPPDSDDPYIAHSFFNSMSLHIPEEIMESVKSTVDGSSQLQNCSVPIMGSSKDNSDNVSEQFRRDRRPALDRKRARFSLKPDSSPIKIGFETTLDIQKLKDPEEFFSAFERLENAKLEMQKHTKQAGSILKELNDNNMSMVQRSRRPGISRKSAKYKHRYSTGLSSQENLEERIISRSPSKTFHENDVSNAHLEEKRDVVGETLTSSHGTDVPNAHSEGTDVMVAQAESKVNEFLDNLLKNSDEELDGENAKKLLQKHLQIKPISVQKLLLPGLQEIRRIDNKVSAGRLASPRIMFPGIQSLLKGTSNQITQQGGSPVQRSASPTPEKNPFASISLLGKQISQSSPIPDPFSPDIMYQSPRDSVLPENSFEELDEVHKEKEQSMSDAARSLIAERTKATLGPSENSGANMIPVGIDTDAGTVQNVHSPLKILPASISSRNEQSEHDVLKSATVDENQTKSASSKKYKSDCANVPGISADVSSNVSQPELQHQFCGNASENSGRCDDQVVNEAAADYANVPGISADVSSGVSQPGMRDLLCGNASENSGRCDDQVVNVAGADIRGAEPVEISDKAEIMQHEVELSAEVLLPVDNLSRGQTNSKHSHDVVEENDKDKENAKDKHTETIMGQDAYTAEKDDRSGELQSEKQQKAASRQSTIKRNILAMSRSQNGDASSEVQIKKKRKVVSRPTGSKRKDISHRQSLAAYGTEMQSGLRRSTRIRSRPLEYWNGEKFLYGRVHSSLPTVVGIRYGSPVSGGKPPCLKVKSFVPSEYMNIVERASFV